MMDKGGIKKHPITIGSLALSEGQIYRTFYPVLETLKARQQQLGFHKNGHKGGLIGVAYTGFANYVNDKHLCDSAINSSERDNAFDAAIQNLQIKNVKYGKRSW